METKTCKDCKYFKRYYIIHRLAFREVEKGQCSLHISRKQISKKADGVSCPHFCQKEKEQEKQQINAGIEHLLDGMLKRLNEICDLLNYF